MEKGQIIEPCCCERQLPQLIKSRMKDGEAFAFFATNGDVLLSHLLKSVSYLAGNQHRLLIALPEIDIEGLRVLAHFLGRGWTQELQIVTREVQDELIRAELSEYIEKIQYAADPMVLDGMMAIMPSEVRGEGRGVREYPAKPGTNRTVIIQGAVLTKVDFSLCHYAIYCGKSEEVINGAISPLLAKLHVKSRRLS